MKTLRQPFIRLTSIAFVIGALAACSGDNSPDPTPTSPPQSGNMSNTTTISATAGGFGAPPGDPANKYTYFNLATKAVVELTDAQAATSSDWHIGFKRTNVKLNGGVSGSANTKGAVVDAKDDFYDANGDPDNSVFLNATAASEVSSFDAVVDVSGLTFKEDRYIPYITGDGSNDGWWFYAGPPTHTISANTDKWWLIKSAASNSYAKFHVTDIVQTSRDITLELFIQSVSDNAFSTVPTSWTATIGATGGSKCFDIDTAAEADCSAASADWDLKVEVAGQSWNIWTNGGVSGSGSGGAFGSFDTAGANGYVSGTTDPGGTSIASFYRQDSAGGLFKDNTWYAYSLQGNNKLWPNYRVYAIDTGAAEYKLQILSFYDDTGASGHITLRHTSVPGTGTVNVTLKEWSVSLDKTTVKAGNVNFRVTNKGPDDVHEFVVIKTDLAPNMLPGDSQGVNENGANITIIGEIENIGVGVDVRVTSMDLEPGNYVLICNIWDEDEQESHYHEGMRVAFTVTAD